MITESTPSLEYLTFENPSIRLNIGESTILECRTIPYDADIKNLVWETNNPTVIFLNASKNDTRRCKITASSEHYGKGSVRCYDKTTGIGAICNIEVAAVRNTGLILIRWLVFFAVLAILYIMSLQK